MNLTCNGKIGRLPVAVREELNRRMENGDQGGHLLAWLNSLPEVQAVVEAEFEDKPIRKQNLSEWRKGGYQKWLAHKQTQEVLGQMVAEGDDLIDRLGEAFLDKLTAWLIPNFVAEARVKLATAKSPDERWSVLQSLCVGLVPLLRGNFYAGRLRLEKERLEITRRLTREQEEAKFEEWLKRPDIKERVRPKVTRDRAVRRIMNILDHFLLGEPMEDFEYLHDEETEDPAIMI
jgi:hypothetical protein